VAERIEIAEPPVYRHAEDTVVAHA
jgi:hypothetical protein